VEETGGPPKRVERVIFSGFRGTFTGTAIIDPTGGEVFT